MTKFELPEKPKKTNTSEDFNNLRKSVDELDKFDYAWKTYANKADRRINTANKHIEELERENQRLVAENLAVKTLVDNAKPQQALPVVPECVGEWIEKNISVAHNAELMIHNILICAIDNKNRYLFPLEVEKFVLKNPITFLNAVITGKYEVEKPQQKRYEVKLLSGESMYFNPIGNPKNIKDYRFSFGNYAGWKTQFTKSELAEIKDGMFLKRIPGGTPLDDLGKDKSYYVWIEDCNYWKNPFIELVPVEDGE